MKIGIIGTGAIGSFLAKEINKLNNVELHAISDINENNINSLLNQINNNDNNNQDKQPKVLSKNDLINECDLIIEAAHPNIVKEVLQESISKNKKLIIMSIGGLLDCLELTNYKNLYLPSGAIGGIDLLHAASEENINSIILQTSKSPQSLGLNDISEQQTIFEGSVEEAVKQYPKNINVAARLAIAAKDPSKVRVKIQVDPNIKTNQHEIFIKGDFGESYFKIQNIKSPKNPKTSYLACLSAINKVKEIINK